MQYHVTTGGDEALAQRLDAVGWGLFIIWIGVAILSDIGWGWTLFGTAAIILGGSAIRWSKKLPIEGFWVIMGLILLVAAIWEFFAMSWRLLPILIIGFGLLVLLGAFRGRQPRAR